MSKKQHKPIKIVDDFFNKLASDLDSTYFPSVKQL